MSNDDQIAQWDGPLGDAWVANQERIDAWLAPLGDSLLARFGDLRGRRVLDVGCGCGTSALRLARMVGAGGAVIGLDVARAMLAYAAARASTAGFEIEWRHGDASREDLTGLQCDFVHSRFGVMFFDDNEAAFANLRTALVPGGRLEFICWQDFASNEWASGTLAATDPVLGPRPARDAAEPGPFALADREMVGSLLRAAGFESIECFDDTRLLHAGTLDAAVEMFADQVGPAARRLGAEADPMRRADARDAVRDWLRGRIVGDVVALRAATRIWSARRPSA